MQYPVLKLDVDGSGSVDDDATLINVTNLDQLNAIRYDLDGNGTVDNDANAATYDAAFSGLATGTYNGYELRNDLDFNDAGSYASSTINTNWTTGSGWDPIGYYTTFVDSGPFTAIFEGNGHTISNLFIDRPSTENVGLFVYGGGSAALRNIGLLEVKVTAGGRLGTLAGLNLGDISGSYATGSVTGRDPLGSPVGGLVGLNAGNISGSYATVAVTGISYLGGLVGRAQGGTISDSYATGTVTGTTLRIGGLVGEIREARYPIVMRRAR